MIVSVSLRLLYLIFIQLVVWVPETRLTSCDLPIFMEEAAEPVVAADAGEVGLGVFRERA
jgi:hypothetical protein